QMLRLFSEIEAIAKKNLGDSQESKVKTTPSDQKPPPQIIQQAESPYTIEAESLNQKNIQVKNSNIEKPNESISTPATEEDKPISLNLEAQIPEKNPIVEDKEVESAEKIKTASDVKQDNISLEEVIDINKQDSPPIILTNPVKEKSEIPHEENRPTHSIHTHINILAPNPSKDVVCRLTGIYKSFKKTDFSLKNINIELKIGQITGLVGENGNGKTTLFQILTGNLAHDKGQILYPFLNQFSTRKDWNKIKSNIAYVTQELPIWYGSLWENLTYEATVRGLDKKANKREVDYIVHRLGLAEYFDRDWKELSGGYKLRFALARALVWKPKLLVLDEPLANLDIIAQLLVLNDLRDLTKSIKYPLSIIISSQHLHEIENISDKLIYLKDGNIEFYGGRNELGLNREYNSFEIHTELSYEDFLKHLGDLNVLAVEDNGLNYVVTTSLSITAHDLLRKLIDEQTPIGYFRDINTSTKRLFT
ncbi:MAG: ABC transporter ATP-binding protein, partial [Bacteroidota bacterium]